jgi:hypothetical protein
VTEASLPEGGLPGTSEHGYALDCRLNDSFTAVNRLLAEGAKISRARCPVEVGGTCLPQGSFVVRDAKIGLLEKLAGEFHLVFHPLEERIEDTVTLGAPRIGMYQRYWGGNIDEGWTRFVLEQFEFPYTTLKDEEVKRGNLKQRFDAIILPSDPEAVIIGKDVEEYFMKRYGDMMPAPNFPPEYRSGIGDEGVEKLKKFVENGGTLICLDEACELAIKQFKLKLKDILDGLSPKEFFCPGSTLHACFDTAHPAAYGMPADSLVFFWNSRALEILPSGENERYEVVASYPERDILESGWLIGEEKLRRRAAMVVTRHGQGKVVLIGFRPQHRAQTHGTYKLLFNSLYS